jgi:hypothetical protein
MTKLASLAFALTLLAACLATGAAQAADTITGSWAFEVEIAGNQGTPTFTFEQDGEKLTGKYKGQFGEKDLTGTLKDGDIQFSFEVQEGAKAVYKGKVDGDSMKGTCDYAGQAEGTWTAKKKEE